MPEQGTEHARMPGQGTEPAGMPGPGAEAGDHPERGEPTPGASAERHRLENEFLLAMRRAGSVMQLLGQVSADRIGINATDLNCLNIVALTGHMTAGDLARQTGLSTASITGVLDRLEEGGFVRRVRDPHDRRRVIVELADGPGLREVGTHVRAGGQGVAGRRGELLRRRAAPAAGVPGEAGRDHARASWPGCATLRARTLSAERMPAARSVCPRPAR